MGDWNADENPYEVLGLTVEATKDEQRKVEIFIYFQPQTSNSLTSVSLFAYFFLLMFWSCVSIIWQDSTTKKGHNLLFTSTVPLSAEVQKAGT